MITKITEPRYKTNSNGTIAVFEHCSDAVREEAAYFLNSEDFAVFDKVLHASPHPSIGNVLKMAKFQPEQLSKCVALLEYYLAETAFKG